MSEETPPDPKDANIWAVVSPAFARELRTFCYRLREFVALGDCKDAKVWRQFVTEAEDLTISGRIQGLSRAVIACRVIRDIAMEGVTSSHADEEDCTQKSIRRQLRRELARAIDRVMEAAAVAEESAERVEEEGEEQGWYSLAQVVAITGLDKGELSRLCDDGAVISRGSGNTRRILIHSAASFKLARQARKAARLGGEG